MKTMNKDFIVYLSVTNDVITDQRIHRMATTMVERGFTVHVVGRKLLKKYDFSSFPFNIHLLKLPFRKGMFFYASYNIYLFFFLLLHRNHLLVANDLDTIIPNYFVSKLKGIPLLFDSHEYFPEVPELIHRKKIKAIWQWIEKTFVPRVNECYTVCQSIAKIYEEKYQKKFEVIRNVPYRKNVIIDKKEENNKIILYQGALNMGRGIEKVIEAMKYLPNYYFYIVGSGDIEKILKEKAFASPAKERIVFTGRVTPEHLFNYTCKAQLGISLEEPMGLNYFYALPNKLFDYIQARVPVLVSDLPEMRNIAVKYDIGRVTSEFDPYKLSYIIREMMEDTEKRNVWKRNLEKAAHELCWENEQLKLLAILDKISRK